MTSTPHTYTCTCHKSYNKCTQTPSTYLSLCYMYLGNKYHTVCETATYTAQPGLDSSKVVRKRPPPTHTHACTCVCVTVCHTVDQYNKTPDRSSWTRRRDQTRAPECAWQTGARRAACPWGRGSGHTHARSTPSRRQSLHKWREGLSAMQYHTCSYCQCVSVHELHTYRPHRIECVYLFEGRGGSGTIKMQIRLLVHGRGIHLCIACLPVPRLSIKLNPLVFAPLLEARGHPLIVRTCVCWCLH